MRFRSSSSSAWLGGALFLLSATPVFAAPFVVSDVTYVHSAETTHDSHYYAPLAEDLPGNWRSPVDYASGSVVVRLEVLSKPSDAPTRFQVCFEGTPSYACTYQAPTYTDVGVYTWETPFSGFWSPSSVDWSRGIHRAALILKDTSNGKPAPENVGQAESARYMPTELRVTITLVPPGESYVPPEEASEPDAGPDDEEAPDAGESDAGAPDTGAPDAGVEAPVDVPDDAGARADAGPPDAGEEPALDAGVNDGEGADAGVEDGDVEDGGADDAGSEAPGDAPTSGDSEAAEDKRSEAAGCSATTAGNASSGTLLLGAALASLVSRWRRRRRCAWRNEL